MSASVHRRLRKLQLGHDPEKWKPDPPFVAAAIQEFGADLALPGNAGVEAIRAAAQQILFTQSFKQNVRERAKALAGVDGAANAAGEVESLLGAV